MIWLLVGFLLGAVVFTFFPTLGLKISAQLKRCLKFKTTSETDGD